MRLLFLFCLLVALPLGASPRHFQNDSGEVAMISMCELAKNPDRYTGKTVRVRGWIGGQKDISLLDVEPTKDCPPEILVIVLPNQAKPKPDFQLVEDEAYRAYSSALNRRTQITGTFEGRFDSAVTLKNGKRVKVRRGFGHRGRATMRLVLQKVSDLDIRPTRSIDR
jgi:hypothetical protein